MNRLCKEISQKQSDDGEPKQINKNKFAREAIRFSKLSDLDSNPKKTYGSYTS